MTDTNCPTTAYYVGRHRAPDAADFLGTFAEAADEHTLELAAIAVESTRPAAWFARNLTSARLAVMAAAVGVFAGAGLGWWLA